MFKQIWSLAKKELSTYFGSPLATIFLGAFLTAVLFIFFTIETFFARGLADVRPLFRWMPLVLIFLLAALTMRQWSEEQRAGTQELLLTLPISSLNLVLGKFMAVMLIILLALVLTLPLPISVSFMGNLDWGPVFGGYIASLLMASAYASIGLFVSSRTDNQIVALIATAVLGGIFYVVGTDGITTFFSGSVSEILWAIGTGSRFESIERGVIDLRDLVYYLSITTLFLTLNTISLDSIRWSQKQTTYRQRALITGVLISVNLILLNIWLYPLQGLRLDLTEQREYSLSQTTEDIFQSLNEPLLIRAYISEKNIPQLAPLVPRIRDLLREYEIASDGRIVAEVIDPITDPQLEAEANQTYGIRPTPFQISGRNEASVINAYFDILIRYGDQTVLLSFQDIVEVQLVGNDVSVGLRNLEYDLTRSIKKVVFGFQSVESVLAALEEPATLTFYLTSQTLPADLIEVETVVSQVAGELASQSGGKFIYDVVDLDDPNSNIPPDFLLQTYGIQPIPTTFFGGETFYAHMILQSGEQLELLYPPAVITEAEIRTLIESAIKRTTAGFLKVVGIWSPPETDTASPTQGTVPQTFKGFNSLREQLRQEYTVQDVDLSTGQIASNIDTLLLLAPQDLTEQELFTIDQYMMRGGSVIVALSNYNLFPDQFTGGLNLLPADTTNITAWLAHHGVSLQSGMVLDLQNQPFPVAVVRDAGGFQVQEIQAIDYPFFVDVRANGMDTENPIVANLPAVSMNWASPVELAEGHEGSVFLESTNEAWLREETNIIPNFDLYPQLGFAENPAKRPYPLAVSTQGQFESYFAERPSPFTNAQPQIDPTTGQPIAPSTTTLGVINESPEETRLLVLGSALFVEDVVLNLSQRLGSDQALNNLQLMQNSVDWSVEDLDLLAIRSRGTTTRTLLPYVENSQTFWEIANYVLALVALLGLYIGWRIRGQNEPPMELVEVTE